MEDTEGLSVSCNYPSRPVESIESLGLDEYLKTVLREVVKGLSPALQYGLPIAMQPESFFLSSPSGTFTSVLSIIGLIQSIDSSVKSLQAVVVFPRKTLIDEYIERFNKFNSHKKIKWVKCVGGEFFNKKHLHSANLLLCTPGKLLSLLDSRSINLGNIKVVAFDVCNHLFVGDIKPQSESILSKLPSNITLWFISPIPDEVSKEAFLRRCPDGKTVEILDGRVFKQVKFFYKFYESEDSIFEYLNERCERFEGQIVVFSSDVGELDRACVAIGKWGVSKLSDIENVKEQIRIRDEFCEGRIKALVCQGNYAMVRKVLCKGVVEVFVLDNVNGDMLVARARRGSFRRDDKLVLFCKEYEKEDVEKLGQEVGVEFFNLG